MASMSPDHIYYSPLLMVSRLSRFDGILGLALRNISVNHIIPPFYQMVDQGLVEEPVFSFRIGPSEQDGGEVVFGGVDPSHYSGDITFYPVEKMGYWQISLRAVTLGNLVGSSKHAFWALIYRMYRLLTYVKPARRSIRVHL